MKLPMICGVLALSALVACVESQEVSSSSSEVTRSAPELPAEEVSSTAEEAAAPLICSWGYYVCPDDGTDWDYAGGGLACVQNCMTMGTKAQVHTLCNNYCNAACVVGGEWFACTP